MTTESPEFLEIDDVLEVQALQIARYGGAGGVRDRALLESAVAQSRVIRVNYFFRPRCLTSGCYRSSTYGVFPG